MSSVFLAGSKQRSSLGASTTRYSPFADATQLYNAAANIYTVQTAGVASNLYIRLAVNNRGASTYKLFLNGSAGNLSISITASTTGEFEDNSNTDTIAAGDEVEFQTVTGAGGTNFIASVSGALFTATTNTVQRVGAIDGGTLNTASTSFYVPLGGSMLAGSTTEADQQIDALVAGTLKNFGVRVSTNTRGTATAVGLRVNTAAGNVGVSVTASTTGTFEDTTNTDSVSVGDDINGVITLGTGTGDFRSAPGAWIEYETTDGSWQTFTAQAGGADATFAASTTYFLPIGGILTNDYTATEAESSTEPQIAFLGSKLTVRVATNAVTAASTLRLRINAANGNQSVSITGLTTGQFQDSSNTDLVQATDNINYSLACGAGGTSLIAHVVSMLCTHDRRAVITWAELEVPNAARRAVVTFAELEVPNAARRGVVTWAELEVPDAPVTDRRAVVTWAELEVPNAARRAVITWAELEVPDVGSVPQPEVGGGGPKPGGLLHLIRLILAAEARERSKKRPRKKKKLEAVVEAADSVSVTTAANAVVDDAIEQGFISREAVGKIRTRVQSVASLPDKLAFLFKKTPKRVQRVEIIIEKPNDAPPEIDEPAPLPLPDAMQDEDDDTRDAFAMITMILVREGYERSRKGE